MVTELQVQDNKLHRLFEKFSRESQAVTVASVSMIVALLSLLMAWMAVDAAKTAQAVVEAQDRYIEELATKTSIKSNRLSRLEAYLKSKGVPIDDINE